MTPSTQTDHVTLRRAHGAIRRYCLTLAIAVIGLFCSSCEALVPTVSASDAPGPFFEDADFDPAIPNPQTVIGHGIAEEAVRYDGLMQYLETLAESSPRVTLTRYGESHK